MKKRVPTNPTDSKKGIQTSTLAERFDYSSATIRKHLCLKGHFLGLTPYRMPNGRNLWPDVYPQQIKGVE